MLRDDASSGSRIQKEHKHRSIIILNTFVIHFRHHLLLEERFSTTPGISLTTCGTSGQIPLYNSIADMSVEGRGMGVSLCMSHQGHSRQPYEDRNKLLVARLIWLYNDWRFCKQQDCRSKPDCCSWLIHWLTLGSSPYGPDAPRPYRRAFCAPQSIAAVIDSLPEGKKCTRVVVKERKPKETKERKIQDNARKRYTAWRSTDFTRACFIVRMSHGFSLNPSAPPPYLSKLVPATWVWRNE